LKGITAIGYPRERWVWNNGSTLPVFDIHDTRRGRMAMAVSHAYNADEMLVPDSGEELQ
jgi:hypothetical protein